MVTMGRIIAPYGVLGWLKVKPSTEAIDGLRDYKTWWLGDGKNWQEYTLEKAKVHNDILLVKLFGVNDRDMAFACKGQQVAEPRTALPATDIDEYYWSDLIGLTVTNKEGVVFGTLVDVFETGANDVIVVKAAESEGTKATEAPSEKQASSKKQKKPVQQERLIPFVADVIIDVDLPARAMLVDWHQDY